MFHVEPTWQSPGWQEGLAARVLSPVAWQGGCSTWNNAGPGGDAALEGPERVASAALPKAQRPERSCERDVFHVEHALTRGRRPGMGGVSWLHGVRAEPEGEARMCSTWNIGTELAANTY
jgi:hypothetical protein